MRKKGFLSTKKISLHENMQALYDLFPGNLCLPVGLG